jgi:ABC-type nitrate/sulfonate/bicarbonate transport system permease component
MPSHALRSPPAATPAAATPAPRARPWRTAGLIVAPWLLIVALWYALAYSGLINPALLPKPHTVLERFWQLMQDRLPMDMLMSTGRVIIGVALGIVLAVPHMLTALRVALGVAWATLVASELIAAQQGLGALIQNASSFFQLDIIYLGIICIGFIALAMDTVLRIAARRLVSWQDRIA